MTRDLAPTRAAVDDAPRRWRLHGGRVVTPDAVLDGAVVRVEGRHVASVEAVEAAPSEADEVDVDLAGAYLLPGLIDVHADYIEHMAAPRPTAMLDFRFALREAERELITHGITTMFHSLALYGFDAFATNPVRRPGPTKALIDVVHASHRFEHVLHHRLHARLEIDDAGRVEELAGYLRAGKVHLLSFMDHTPGQGQYRDLEAFREAVKGYGTLDDAGVDALIARSRDRALLDADTLAALARVATEHGVAVASHDDDGEAKVDLAASFGTTISEFPITLDVARYARAKGLHTVAGAPNVLLGGSHSGNLSAEAAVLDGAVDVLCSDYYPAALLRAIFALHARHGGDLARFVRLATTNAAVATRIDHETGALVPGLRADLIAVHVLGDGSPAVTDAFAAGAPVYRARYRTHP
jgi:alpha-D-ribose 1-methylphosphonate 5-triphosphate diphosphatase